MRERVVLDGVKRDSERRDRVRRDSVRHESVIEHQAAIRPLLYVGGLTVQAFRSVPPCQ